MRSSATLSILSCLLLAVSSVSPPSDIVGNASIAACFASGRRHSTHEGVLRGVDASEPLQLSWTVAFSGRSRGMKQTAYEVEVEANGALFWKSGSIASEYQRAIVPIALARGTYYSWRVRSKLTNGALTRWSEFNLLEVEPKEPFANMKWIGGGCEAYVYV